MSLIGMLGSSVFGSLFGGIMGLGQKWLDLKQHRMDLEHELDLRDKDMDQTRLEIEGRTKVAEVQAAGEVSVADANALAASYAADRATYGIKLVDGIRGVVRPVITTAAMVELYICGQAAWAYVLTHGGLTEEQAYAILDSVIATSALVVTWWFGSRPKQK